QQLHDLNLTHRGTDKPTNVLSFPAYSAAELDNLSAPGPPVILGDIAMAFETVARESAARGIDFSSHATHLMIHGYLHVLGFNHETGDAAAAMEAKEIAFCARFGIANPYAIEG
ncbi:MAG: rRNA maturation RNase YbeY, partial [Pseudomonadota bacterium]